MSIVSTIHDVTTYTPKSVPMMGQRLAKVTWKTDKVSGVKKESKCVSIPLVSDDDISQNLSTLLPAIKDFIASQQDAIIRNLVDSGKETIRDEDISMVAIANYAESESTGGRLTKELINAWFDSTLSDSLTVAFADKLGISDTPSDSDLVRISAAISIYRDKFSSLAGGKTSFIPEIAEKLEKALEFAPENDELAGKFAVRLSKMKVNASVDMLGL